MSIIKPRTNQKHVVRHITRLFRENNETLFAYARFIGEPTEYVLNQLVESVLAKDKDFQAWRDENPGSHVPAPGSGTRARRRAATSSVSSHAPAAVALAQPA
ncbi:MAG: hypothetical protein AB7I36_18980 [Rhodospirillaceae bacterium]